MDDWLNIGFAPKGDPAEWWTDREMPDLPEESERFFRKRKRRCGYTIRQDPFKPDLEWNGEKRCWKKLANAIVLQAAIDWREAKAALRRKSTDREAREMVKETEAFFLSDYCMLLTKLDGSEILERLKKEFAS